MPVASACNCLVSQPPEQHSTPAPPSNSNTAYRRGELESENVKMTANGKKKKVEFKDFFLKAAVEII